MSNTQKKLVLKFKKEIETNLKINIEDNKYNDENSTLIEFNEQTKVLNLDKNIGELKIPVT